MNFPRKINTVPYVITASLTFIAFIIIGTRLSSDVISQTISQLVESLSVLAAVHPIALVLIIFINNAFKCFLAIVSGILLGIPSLIFLTTNAVTIGMLAIYMSKSTNVSVIIGSLAPHGIIEIPLLVFSTSLGLAIGSEMLRYITRQSSQVKLTYAYALRLYLRWMIPLFLVAAIIEVFITPIIVTSLGGTTGTLIP